jgi:1,4-alpha-glucan branching enzyme
MAPEYNRNMPRYAVAIKRIAVAALLLTVCSCGRYLARSLDSPCIDGSKVVFRMRCPSARTVQVAGDWQGNNWAEGDAEAGEVLVGLMKKVGEEGIWEATVNLPPGRYRYRFLVDESVWYLDVANPRVVDDGRGGKANLLIMP